MTLFHHLITSILYTAYTGANILHRLVLQGCNTMNNNNSNQNSFSVYLRDTFNYYLSRAATLFNWLQPSYYISRPLLISCPQYVAPSETPSTFNLINELLGWQTTTNNPTPETDKKDSENKIKHACDVKNEKLAAPIAPLSQSLKNAFINAAHGNIQITPPITFAVKNAIDKLPERCCVNLSHLIYALEKLINAKLIIANELPTSIQLSSATHASNDSLNKTRSELLIEMLVLSLDCSELICLLLKMNQRSPLVIEKVKEIQTFLDNQLLSISEFEHILDTLYVRGKREKQTSSDITALSKLTKTEELTTFINSLNIEQDIKEELLEYLDESHSHAFTILHR